MTNKIKINELQTELKKVFNCGYGETISLKFNGQQIPNFDLLRFTLPTTDNIKLLSKYLIELKINGEYYEVLKC